MWWFPRLAEAVAVQPLAQLLSCIFRRRHATIADHGLGEPHGGGGIDVLAMDGVAVSEAAAAGVLHTPGAAAGRPLDTSPDLPVDGEVIMGDPAMLPEPGLDDAKAAFGPWG